MFKSITLGNFKAFGPTQRIPIRPLTLIFGPNSAGKSSFIHSLLFAHEALISNEPNALDVKRTFLGGDSVDLGGFRQFIHRSDLSQQVEWGVELDSAELTGRLGELLAPIQLVSVLVTIGTTQADDVTGIRVETYRIETDSTILLRASVKRRGDTWRMGVDELDTQHPVIHNVIKAIIEATTTAESIGAGDHEAIQSAIDQLVPELSLVQGGFLPSGLQRGTADQLESQQTPLFPISRGNRLDDLQQAALFFLPRSLNELVRDLNQLVETRLRSLRYLGPLRSYPPRHLAFAQYHDPNWHAGGGFAWDRVRMSPEIRKAANRWLGSERFMKTPYQLVVRNLYADDDLYDPLWSMMENVELDIEVDLDRHGTPQGHYAVIKDFDREIENFYDRLRKSSVDSIRDLVLMDVNRKTVVSHRDIGIGISQVLPVLVWAFAADHETVAIEQPEIHLHPALQAELGDVFIESALSGRGNTFLLETHSEHILLRIMRRMRETTSKTLPDDCPEITPHEVMILYVEPDMHGSIVREMPLNELGELVKAWPGGFFEEGLREIF